MGQDRTEGLLDLAFLVDNMLTYDRIKLLDLHLFRHVLLVLRRRIEMAGASAGHQFDLVTHGFYLTLGLW